MPSAPHKPPTSRRRAGFTLVEIMVVIAIIGLILTFVGPNILNRLREAKVTATKVKIENLKGVIEDYRRHHSKVPDSLQELLQPNEKNLGEPYVESDDKLLDSWDNPFIYQRMSNTRYNIISLGADGQEGGEADEADIHSHPGAGSK